MIGVACAAAVVAVMGAAGAARADDYRGTEEQQSACTGDVFRLCWSEVPNVTLIVACLRRERPRLSPACRQVFRQPPPQIVRTRVAATKRYRRHHQVSAD